MEFKCLIRISGKYNKVVEPDTTVPAICQFYKLGIRVRITLFEPYPTFEVEYDRYVWYFNTEGTKVSTAFGKFDAYKLNDMTDIRCLKPSLLLDEHDVF